MRPKTKTAVDLTAARHTQHGLFEDVAATSEALLKVMQQTKNWLLMSAPRRESIKMITHKLARIGAGDFTLADHWDDIGGYALLGRRDGQNDQPTASLKRPRRRPAKKAVKRVAKKPRARPAKKRAAKAVSVRRRGNVTTMRSRRSGQDLRQVPQPTQAAE